MQKNPEEITKAIRGTISIGPGSLKNFSHSGKVVVKAFKWQTYCVIDPLYGGFVADNVLVHSVKINDTWHVEEMTTNGICINSVDAKKIQDVEKVKKRTRKDGKIINI